MIIGTDALPVVKICFRLFRTHGAACEELFSAFSRTFSMSACSSGCSKVLLHHMRYDSSGDGRRGI